MRADDSGVAARPLATLTRRRVVAGAAATAVAATGGGWLAVERSSALRRRLHANGLLEGPDRRVPRGRAAGDVVYHTLDAPDGRSYPWGLWVPPRRDVELCLVCLHGRGGDERSAFEALGVHRFVADAGLGWAVATLDGGTDYWHPRDNGHDPHGALVDGLLPVLAERLQATVPFAALGWSMGGYGVLLLVEQSPVTMVAAVATSPAVWTTFEATAPGAFDDEADYRLHDVLGGVDTLVEGPPVRVDCGADDVFAATSRQLLEAVPEIDGGMHPGFHDEGTWRSFLPDQLRWIDDTAR